MTEFLNFVKKVYSQKFVKKKKKVYSQNFA